MKNAHNFTTLAKIPQLDSELEAMAVIFDENENEPRYLQQRLLKGSGIIIYGTETSGNADKA